MTWCKSFKEARNRFRIMLYEGEYYLCEEETAEPSLDPIKFCPWCAARLTLEDI